MLIQFETPNGKMEIQTKRFFPAKTKDIQKLKKSIMRQEDLEKFLGALDLLIDQAEKYANNCSVIEEVHEMSMREMLEGSFEHICESATKEFYHKEALRGLRVKAALEANKEVLNGKR